MTPEPGWPLSTAPPSVAEVARWLATGRRLTEADDLVVRCETARGESVYVEVRDDRLLISDRGETCAYLEAGDSAHRPMEPDAVRPLCEERGAQLIEIPDMWPHIVAANADTVAEAVFIVGVAIEHVFSAALTVPADRSAGA